jgi:hypothetical protein
MTSILLLRNLHGQLRIWGPEKAMGMDEAYGVSRAMPGAVPIGDDGGGQLLIHGRGDRGAGLYLVETGALAFEDGEWIAPDLTALLERGEGAEDIFIFDPVGEEALVGTPIFDEAGFR